MLLDEIDKFKGDGDAALKTKDYKKTSLKVILTSSLGSESLRPNRIRPDYEK